MYLLPIPGGPLNNAAFQGPVGLLNVLPIALGLLKLRSQDESPVVKKQQFL